MEILDEEEVREKWRLSYYICIFVTFFFNLKKLSDSYQFFKVYGFFFILAINLISILVWWGFYHCAYKMKGTILLMLIIISIPLSISLEIQQKGFPERNALFFKAIEIYYWINCIYLHRVNRNSYIVSLKTKYFSHIRDY